MASCMIKAKPLYPTLEVKPISSVTHILNRSPRNDLDGKTPFESWCNRKLVVSHFRVFGCLAWENLSSRSCKALIPQPCNFIGYEDRMKAYRLMDPKKHEIFVEMDVHFEESSPNLSSTLSTSFILWRLIVTPTIFLQQIQTSGVLSIVVVRGHDINPIHMLIFP